MSTPGQRPTLLVLAGPNGAGKSTFFEQFLKATGLRFVNADLIAKALSPDDVVNASYAAAQVAAVQHRLLIEEGESFCMETVFSDPQQAKLNLLLDAERCGYEVKLLFIGLESPELSQARVVERVESGGHDVPDDKIFGRYPRTLANLKRAAAQLEDVRIYDNSDAEHPYRLVARLERGRVTALHEPLPAWLDNLLPG